MENSKLHTIRKYIGKPALYEQLAEECTELAQASLKKARKLRGENYTPKTDDEINHEILEEFTDVLLVADTLMLKMDPYIYAEKLDRWIARNE